LLLIFKKTLYSHLSFQHKEQLLSNDKELPRLIAPHSGVSCAGVILAYASNVQPPRGRMKQPFFAHLIALRTALEVMLATGSACVLLTALASFSLVVVPAGGLFVRKGRKRPHFYVSERREKHTCGTGKELSHV
jgi:hypothetical protein